MDSILTSIKLQCGIEESFTHFDDLMTTHINTVFATLHDQGVGPKEGFSITGKQDTWEHFLPDPSLRNLAKTCVGIRVRLMFDPPGSTAIAQSFKETADMLEWRLYSAANYTEVTDESK